MGTVLLAPGVEPGQDGQVDCVRPIRVISWLVSDRACGSESSGLGRSVCHMVSLVDPGTLFPMTECQGAGGRAGEGGPQGSAAYSFHGFPVDSAFFVAPPVTLAELASKYGFNLQSMLYEVTHDGPFRIAADADFLNGWRRVTTYHGLAGTRHIWAAPLKDQDDWRFFYVLINPDGTIETQGGWEARPVPYEGQINENP